ncbi:MAG: hypothetical protein LBT46_01500 [Planctomycetaceae bacterium]|nr:hypothetical protein [Planctomycetaceae bacterium]
MLFFRQTEAVRENRHTLLYLSPSIAKDRKRTFRDSFPSFQLSYNWGNRIETKNRQSRKIG